jgi:hypothetical protein
VKAVLVVLLVSTLAFGQAADTTTTCQPRGDGSFLCYPDHANAKRAGIALAGAAVIVVIVTVIHHRKHAKIEREASASQQKTAEIVSPNPCPIPVVAPY